MSLRYGGGQFDLRSFILRTLARLQGKPVEILDSDPILCGQVLASSKVKGSFIESLLATPAWHPVYSIESMDGDHYEQLIQDFRELLARLNWRTRLTQLTQKYANTLAELFQSNPELKLDSPTLTRLVLRILYELLFESEIEKSDEELFYQASLEWRREIALKGKANSAIKAEFMQRLTLLISNSPFKEGLLTYAKDPSSYLSVFAQPFLISPQINLSDIYVTVFEKLKSVPELQEKSLAWARTQDRARLGGVILESIRLKHPFPILERELTQAQNFGGKNYAKGTQFFILLDQFKQDPEFYPERWLLSASENPYASIPFAAGPRMCIGKPIAMELMVELLLVLLTEFEFERIEPKNGHLYSGRDNDGGESFGETIYQLRMMLRAVWRSAKIRHL